MEKIIEEIQTGKTFLGIEFGSTRIKAVLIGSAHTPLAEGSCEWENRLEDGLWTYHLEDVRTGMQVCYRGLAEDVFKKYGVPLETAGAIGISAMMHGYLAFDKEQNLLTPFRTWRNTNTGEAAAALTELFHYNIPLRWSVSHLYQCILNKDPHVEQIAAIDTLAGYVHWCLTGERVLGIGDASGMFPIDIETGDYDLGMIELFQQTVNEHSYAWNLYDILPKVKKAGENSGKLTEAGARLLDPSGTLKPGIPFCPPEGDAGTGMTATNSVAVRTGNVSAGTSIFGMVVLEHGLSKVYPELDLVTTPDGSLVAMAHCNNCTSDLNAWVNLFGEFAEEAGIEISRNELFALLYKKAMEADPLCGKLLAYNYVSGEPVTGILEGRPLFMRKADSSFTLSNFMRAHLNASFAALKVGMDLLTKKEGARIDNMTGHGGIFKTEGVAQQILADALNTPVTVMKTAGEGGPWGMALLAQYMIEGENRSLAEWLTDEVFHAEDGKTLIPTPEGTADFDAYMQEFLKALPVEQAAEKYYS